MVPGLDDNGMFAAMPFANWIADGLAAWQDNPGLSDLLSVLHHDIAPIPPSVPDEGVEQLFGQLLGLNNNSMPFHDFLSSLPTPVNAELDSAVNAVQSVFDTIHEAVSQALAGGSGGGLADAHGLDISTLLNDLLTPGDTHHLFF